MKLHSRIGAVLSSNENEVRLIGYGTYAGEEVPPDDPTRKRGLMGLVHKMERKNPKLIMDNGRVIWGCECWWASEEFVKESMGNRKVIELKDYPNERLTAKQLKEKYGTRSSGASIDFPQELGYRCPEGHSILQWSEFNDHIWCEECKKDYHYAQDCVLIKDEYNPKDLPEQPRIIEGITNMAEDGNHFNDIPKELLNLEEDKNE